MACYYNVVCMTDVNPLMSAPPPEQIHSKFFEEDYNNDPDNNDGDDENDDDCFAFVLALLVFTLLL